MAKFGVNVVVLVDNMPLVFFYFSPKPLKKNSCTAYTMKKKFGRSIQLKKKFLQEKFFYPPPRISNGPPLTSTLLILHITEISSNSCLLLA